MSSASYQTASGQAGNESFEHHAVDDRQAATATKIISSMYFLVAVFASVALQLF